MNNDHTIKTTKVAPCTCKHDYQDARYGKGNRVFNPRKGGEYTCTVCGTKKTI